MNIMLVEDDELVAQATEAFLLLRGHTVIGPFSTAAEVFRAIRYRPPDLALMDIGLAGRCNGLDCARVLSRRHGIPVMLLSAHADRARLGEGSGLGYLERPVSPDLLTSVLRVITLMMQGQQTALLPTEVTMFQQLEPSRPVLR